MFIETISTLAQGVLNFFVNSVDFFTESEFLQNLLNTIQKYIPLVGGVPSTIIEWLLNNLAPFVLELSLAEILLYSGVPLILAINILKWYIGIVM